MRSALVGITSCRFVRWNTQGSALHRTFLTTEIPRASRCAWLSAAALLGSACRKTRRGAPRGSSPQHPLQHTPSLPQATPTPSPKEPSPPALSRCETALVSVAMTIGSKASWSGGKIGPLVLSTRSSWPNFHLNTVLTPSRAFFLGRWTTPKPPAALQRLLWGQLSVV